MDVFLKKIVYPQQNEYGYDQEDDYRDDTEEPVKTFIKSRQDDGDRSALGAKNLGPCGIGPSSRHGQVPDPVKTVFFTYLRRFQNGLNRVAAVLVELEVRTAFEGKSAFEGNS
ncbi:TPA: hypothetical protein DIU27_05680 [Candidatus Collierbacteria bacterium]|nr:hypothetical protein [Candidatus Collierbacteria bacterium]